MMPRRLLRTAAVFSILCAILHTFGMLSQEGIPPGARLVLEGMKSVSFPVMGFDRTYWNFYVGFGLFTTTYFALVGVWSWQIGNFISINVAIARSLLTTMLIAHVAMTILCITNFFWGPIVFSVIIAACLIGSLATSRKTVAS